MAPLPPFPPLPVLLDVSPPLPLELLELLELAMLPPAPPLELELEVPGPQLVIVTRTESPQQSVRRRILALRFLNEHAVVTPLVIDVTMSVAMTPISTRMLTSNVIPEFQYVGETLCGQWATIEIFANVERTTDGGAHVQGLLDGLAPALREANPTWKRRPKNAAMDAVKRGLHAVVCVRLQDPTYDMPTKSRLVTPEVQSAVSSADGDAFVEFIHHHAALVEHFVHGYQQGK